MHKGYLRSGCWLLTAAAVMQASGQEAPLAEIGSIRSGSQTEVGISFRRPVSRDSMISLDNYLLTAGQAQALRVVPQNGSAVLSVTGLQPGEVATLTLTNLQSADGTQYGATALSFTNRAIAWTGIGAQELGFGAEAVAVGDDGFDLISGGVQFREDYDEGTFVFEELTGDFDRRVRVALNPDSSEEARAGLIAREELNAGQSRPASFEEAFGRYVAVHVTPRQTAYSDNGQPVPGSNAYQMTARVYPAGVGSPTFEETLLLASSAPAQTNAWLRLRRVGERFSAFHSGNGTNWTLIGNYSFPTNGGLEQFSTNAYVGPFFSPENGAIPASTGARRAFLAEFREYGVASGNEVPTDPPTLTIVRVGNNAEVRWTGGGTLQTSTTLTAGSWTDVQGTSPHVTPIAGQAKRYFRVRL